MKTKQEEKDVMAVLRQFQNYAHARIAFLSYLGQGTSCRDPLAEFSEVIVAQLLQATLADSRVQKGYDLVRPNGRHVQVKYLANPKSGWINEHHIQFPPSVEDYALVIIVAMQIKSILVFPHEIIGQVCNALKKRHPSQETSLQLTERNYETIIAESKKFQQMGVLIFNF